MGGLMTAVGNGYPSEVIMVGVGHVQFNGAERK